VCAAIQGWSGGDNDGGGLSVMTLLMAKAERGLRARTAVFEFTSAMSYTAAQSSTVITSMVKLVRQSRVSLIVQHVKWRHVRNNCIVRKYENR